MSATLLNNVLANTVAAAAEAREAAAHTGYRATNRSAPDIFFPVAKRPLQALGTNSGATLGVDDHMATVGMINGQPRVLGVVGKDYALVPTRRVVEQADAAMRRIFGADMDRAKIIDQTSFGGAFTSRTYDLPVVREVGAPRHLGSPVAFRVSVTNSYDGSGAMSLRGGTLDLICLNGMTTFNSASNIRKRHTKGVIGFTTAEGWDHAVSRAFTTYEEDIRHANAWALMDLTEDQVVQRLADAKVSDRKAANLLGLFRREAGRRGSNGWALASAITQDATHSPLRDTGRDHNAFTVLQRQEEAAELVRVLLAA